MFNNEVYKRSFRTYMLALLCAFTIICVILAGSILESGLLTIEYRVNDSFADAERRLDSAIAEIDSYILKLYSNQELTKDFLCFFGRDAEGYMQERLKESDISDNLQSFPEDLQKFVSDSGYKISYIYFIASTAVSELEIDSNGMTNYKFFISPSEYTNKIKTPERGYIYKKNLRHPQYMTSLLGTIVFVIDNDYLFDKQELAERGFLDERVFYSRKADYSFSIGTGEINKFNGTTDADYTKRLYFNPFKSEYTFYNYSERYNFGMVHSSTRGQLLKENFFSMMVLVVATVVVYIIMMLFIGLHMRKEAKFLNHITDAMKSSQIGHFRQIKTGQRKDEYALIANAFNDMTEELEEYIAREYLFKIKQNETKMQALLYQINPHFLYNTLETIKSCAIKNRDDDVADALLSLGKMYRMLVNENDIIPFSRELELLDAYLKLIFSVFDQMGAELPIMGVRYDDKSLKVVNALESEEVLSQLDVIHKWYDSGIINADAPTLTETPSYRMFFTAQGWAGAAKSTWGPNMGVEAEAIQFMESVVSNTTVRGSLNAIYSGCKHPEKALEFLQLINSDSKVRDAFYYGLEGDNFKYTADGKVEKLNTDWTMAGYTQGTFFNVSQLSDATFNQWDEVKELNDKATGSVLLGFDLDTTTIENELVNCREIYNKYKSMLLTGAQEPRALAAQMTKEMKQVGLDKVIEEAQKQINAAFGK